jgi:hypothetical protein
MVRSEYLVRAINLTWARDALMIVKTIRFGVSSRLAFGRWPMPAAERNIAGHKSRAKKSELKAAQKNRIRDVQLIDAPAQ